MFIRSLFLFHRDLRLHDNTGLLEAHKSSKEVLPCFIFDSRQIEEHPYRSTPALQFMLESLEELSLDIAIRGGGLLFRSGLTTEVLSHLISEFQIDALFSNRDYTPFARKRDEEISRECERKNIQCTFSGDALLFEPEEIKKDDSKPYTVFTPFYKRSSLHTVRAPVKNDFTNFTPLAPEKLGREHLDSLRRHHTKHYLVRGGRTAAKEVLKNLSSFKNYGEERNIPALHGTTRLSPHNKFGTCSIREVYYSIARHFGKEHDLMRELHWRDFFSHIGWHFPHVFQGAFHPIYDKIEWQNKIQWFEAWCKGITGFPIVDAGMRELHESGFMHNRVRMIVGSFLVKDLHIDWRWGERNFAQKLLDYDPAVNNGNWQWVASSGCDAQPYFRIFNPWLQQEKFDPEGTYIKKWVPELEKISSKVLHTIPEEGRALCPSYVAPIINHADEKRVTEMLYSVVKKNCNWSPGV